MRSELPSWMQENRFSEKTHNVHSLRNDVGFGPSRFSGRRTQALEEVEREQHAQFSDAKHLTVESCASC